jgi:hypothetical protein
MLTERCPLEPPKWGGTDCISENATLYPVQFAGPMDIVYPLASGRHGRKVLGSQWDNNELRYSLRSLEAFFTNMGRVFIATETLPEWLTGVEHISVKDSHRRNKDANLIDKVLVACKAGVSPTFLRLSDDQCLLREWDGLEAWHMGNADGHGGGDWWKKCQRTCDYLKARGRPTWFYDCHCPMPVDRDAFLKVMAEAPYADEPGMCINTLYFNSIDIPRVVMPGLKAAIHKPRTLRKIRRWAAGKLFFGYSEAGTNEALKQFLQEQFPTPSRFEK